MADPERVNLVRARAGPLLWLGAAPAALARQAAGEWVGSPLHRLSLGGPRPRGFLAAPRQARPADAETGQALLNGTFTLAGQTLEVGPQGDPWSRASPSRAFALALHRFDWLRDLMAVGEAGDAPALRLALEWRRVFGRWNPFAWSGEALEPRVAALAGAGRRLGAVASDAEAALLAESLARQARRLLQLAREPSRAAERLAIVAAAGAALSGPAGERLMSAALARLPAALAKAVLADGVHASRSPQAGMELLFDLLALDDALVQRGRPAPENLSRAIDRLTATLRFFTLPDNRLAAFQGGGAASARRVSAARAHDDEDALTIQPVREAPHGGYQRLDGRSLHVMADAGRPARGAWSLAACGQPLAIEVVCGRDRLITGVQWGPDAADFQAARLAAGGSTAELGEGAAGAPLTGLLAFAYGPRLVGGAREVEARRRESETGVWVEMAHDGWLESTGLTHERRLFLDKETDELRGEDRFVPGDEALAEQVAVAIRFHLAPEVRASLARDQRSVLLKGASKVGWWLRNDAAEVAVEPSVVFEDGVPRRSTQVVLRGRLRADRGGRVRWKLAAAEKPAG
ncbi:MAG: heparinase II/III family protein [Caulobacteraceae bacterium]|nr:heparinase II/III family protein [Caulobacteraceae bacterium]